MENNVEIKDELSNMISDKFVNNAKNENEIASVKKIAELIADKNIKKLQVFDVRDEVMKMVCLDCIDLLRKEDGKTDDRKGYLSDYIKMDPCNVVAITALGKKGATEKAKGGYGFDYDYDATIIANYVYCKAFFAEKPIVNIEEYKVYEHIISYRNENSNDCFFRGDTMNSWSTTLDEFFCLRGDEYLNNLNDLGDTEEQKWVEILSNCDNYKENVTLPPYITKFMEVVYTMGNFIPVPIGFNTERNLHLKDYWDLTLLEIYNYYMDKEESSPWLEAFTDWFNKYKEKNKTGQAGWDSFVEKNYMQPFVNKIENVEGAKYGKPKELWNGHFEKKGLPKKEIQHESKDQFQQFFEHATEMILERGRLIAKALVGELPDESETQK